MRQPLRLAATGKSWPTANRHTSSNGKCVSMSCNDQIATPLQMASKPLTNGNVREISGVQTLRRKLNLAEKELKATQAK